MLICVLIAKFKVYLYMKLIVDDDIRVLTDMYRMDLL